MVVQVSNLKARDFTLSVSERTVPELRGAKDPTMALNTDIVSGP